MATVDGGEMVRDLLIAFARIGCPQFVEAFEVVLMEDIPSRTDDSLLEIEVAFVRCKQVMATVREKGTDLFPRSKNGGPCAGVLGLNTTFPRPVMLQR